MTNYYTIKEDKAREHYGNIKDAMQNVLLFGGTLLDQYDRLIITVDKQNDR
jgi:hypothetical protein